MHTEIFIKEEVKAAATRLYDWYRNPSDRDEHVRSILSAQDLERVINVRGGVSSAVTLKRVFALPDFPSIREEFITRWREHFDNPQTLTFEVARAFLRAWSESIDHELVFTGSIIAGQTSALKSNPASDYVTSYHENRSGWTVHLTTSGGVTYHAGIPIKAKRGHVMLIAPDASVHYQRAPEFEDWKHHWAVFNFRPSWKHLLDWPLRSYGMQEVVLTDEAFIDRLDSIFESMIDTYAQPHPLAENLLLNLLEQVLIRVADHLDQSEIKGTDARIFKATEFMQEKLSQKLSNQEIASHCALSESRLSHIFNEELGIGVQKYFEVLRIQQAKRLLVTSSQPISLVAEAVGYSDPAQFSKFFSKHLGTSPRTFRQNFQQKN